MPCRVGGDAVNEVMTFIFNAVLPFLFKCVEWLWNLLFSTLDILPEFVEFIAPLLGIEDVVKSILLFRAIIIMLSLLGMYVSVKNRKKIWTFACGTVGIFSTISLFK